MQNMQQPNVGEPLNKNLLVICGTLIVICLIIVGAVLINKSLPSKTANTGGNNQVGQQPTQVAVDISKVNIQGDPYIGDANAPVVVAFWSDYQCPFCKKAAQEVLLPMIAEYVNSGKVKIVFKDWAFLGADSTTLAQFARAVWEANPSKFAAWHKAIYDNQGTENTGWATQAKIMSITTAAIGAADANKAAQLAAANSSKYQKEIDADKAEGTSFGISGTPGTIIGKQIIVGAQPYATFKAAIDQVLAGK